MILFFTSDHCTWCRVVEQMLNEEVSELGHTLPIIQVDIDRYPTLTKIFNISVVPTLIYHDAVLSGLPSVTDLRDFLLRSLSTSFITGSYDLAQFLQGRRITTTRLLYSDIQLRQKMAQIEELVLDSKGVKVKEPIEQNAEHLLTES